MACFLRKKGSLFLLSALSLSLSAKTDHLSNETKREKDQTLSLKDHGVHGALFDISEEDMIKVLMRRLNALKENGTLEAFQNELKDKARKAVLEPRAVSHITPATQERIFYVDPTLVIEGDVKIPNGIANAGHILAFKGERLNPLHTLKLSKGLLFIDGDDLVQQKLALKMAAQFDVVLVKGKPIALEETLHIPIFFDQGGVLTKRYGIKHVPAKMEMDGDRLKFTEFKA